MIIFIKLWIKNIIILISWNTFWTIYFIRSSIPYLSNIIFIIVVIIRVPICIYHIPHRIWIIILWLHSLYFWCHTWLLLIRIAKSLMCLLLLLWSVIESIWVFLVRSVVDFLIIVVLSLHLSHIFFIVILFSIPACRFHLSPAWTDDPTLL